jgi:hypothetical protein
MARSKYVYVVIGVASRQPVATFTVKHEFVKWVRQLRSPHLFRYYRQVDGTPRTFGADGQWHHADPLELDYRDLLEG